MSKPEYAHRFAPCPAYDVEGMEHWLEDLAAQGLFLTGGGLFHGYGSFEKGAPKALRYRLQPLQKKKYYEDDGLPHRAARELAEEYGWTFLCVIEDYAVYICGDPKARELDTDPQIQALSMMDLYKRRRNHFLFSILYMIYMFFRLWDSPMMLVTLLPLWSIVLPLFIWTLTPFTGLAELTHLWKLHRRLAQGEPLTRTDRRKHRLHRINTVLMLVTIIWIPVFLLYFNFADWREYRWQPLEEYEESLPFATLEDLADGELQPREPRRVAYRDTVLYEYADHIAERSTLFVPRQLALRQHGTVLSDGVTTLDGSLEIEYYELRTEWMAKQLYRELLQSKPKDKYFAPLELNELPTGQEYAYQHSGEVLLLQDGCKVLKVTLDQRNGGAILELDQWAAVMADVFLSQASNTPIGG